MVTNHSLFAYLPWFIFFSNRWLQRKSSLWSFSLLGLCLTLALPVFCAGPEFSYLFGIYLLVRVAIQKSFRLLLELGLIGTISLLLSAIQFLPGLDLLLESKRISQGLSESNILEHSLHPARLLDFFLYLPFGTFDEQYSYWGGKYLNSYDGVPIFFSKFLGTAALTGLISYLLVNLWKDKFLIGSVCFLCVLGFGSFSFLNIYEAFVDYFPGWNKFRYPEKMFLFISFAIVLGVGKGWHAIFESWSESKFRQKFLVLWFVVNGLVCLMYFLLSKNGTLIPTVTWTLFLLSTLSQFVLLVCLQRFKLGREWAWGALFVIFALDLSLHSRELLWPQTNMLLKQKIANTVIDDIAKREVILDHGGAFRYTSYPLQKEAWLLHPKLMGKLDGVGLYSYSVLSRLIPNTNIYYSISTMQSSGTIREDEKSKFIQELFRRSAQKALNIFGVRYVGKVESQSDFEFSIAVNETAFPYLFIPSRIIEANDVGAFLSYIDQVEFSSPGVVILDSDSAIDAPSLVGEFSSLTKWNGKISFTVSDARGDGLIAVNESWNKYWRAFINGRESLIYKMNGWGIGIPVSATHDRLKIEIIYSNPWIKRGVWISLISFLMFFLLCLRGNVRSRRFKD